jgi:hypothetical protein
MTHREAVTTASNIYNILLAQLSSCLALIMARHQAWQQGITSVAGHHVGAARALL